MTSFTGATWAPAPAPEGRTEHLRAATGLGAAAARCMAVRWPDAHGSTVPDLQPRLGHLHDPFAMHNMADALGVLTTAGERAGHIRIVTDYDVDGTTSSLLLQAAIGLRWPEARISYHIPDRFREGYGFSVAAAQAAAKDGVDLIVTADIGVRDHAAVQAATEAGVQVLVADHHLPAGAAVPKHGVVLCPPQADCSYPNPSLAAVGVSLKLAQALLADHPRHERIVRSMLKLAAIGTVADMVSVRTPENRAIVHHGLQALNGDRHSPGLAALLDVAGLTPGQIGASDIGFRIGPRINAAGRLTHADHVVRLLSARDPVQAKVLAQELDQINRERQTLQRALVRKTLADTQGTEAPFVVVSGPEHEGYHRGIVGIVATRLKDEHNRPAAVVSIQDAVDQPEARAVGSVRSVPGVHAVQALDSASDLLEKYGGHPAAAGFSTTVGNLPALAERLGDFAAAARGSAPVAHHRLFDVDLAADDLTPQLFRELASLGPFGMQNPAPRLAVRHVHLRAPRTMGKEAKHLRLQVGPVQGVWWNASEHAQDLCDGPVDLLGELTENHYRGRTTLQFVVKDAARAST